MYSAITITQIRGVPALKGLELNRRPKFVLDVDEIKQGVNPCTTIEIQFTPTAIEMFFVLIIEIVWTMLSNLNGNIGPVWSVTTKKMKRSLEMPCIFLSTRIRITRFQGFSLKRQQIHHYSKQVIPCSPC